MTKQITCVEVYWDSQDPNNEGWAYRVYRGDHEESGPVDADDLDDAIRQTCHEWDLDLEPHNFAREPNVDGGHAVWTADYVDADGDCRECGHPANNSSGHGNCDSPAHN